MTHIYFFAHSLRTAGATSKSYTLLEEALQDDFYDVICTRL